MKMTKNKINVIALFCLSIFTQCSESVVIENPSALAIPVEYAAVSRSDIKEYITFNGVTQYAKKENIRSHITGYISSMNFNLGDRITKNETFALIRTKEQDALGDLFKIDSSLLKTSQPNRIKSNGNGIISFLNITKNDYVAEGDILATVSQPNSLVIQVNIPFEYHDFIKIGGRCEVILPNGKAITAVISGELPVIDPVAQTQAFLINLPNVNLPENLNVGVRIILKENKNALVVPKKAIQTDELLTSFWVMKLQGDTLAIRTKVDILIQNDSLFEIKSNRISIGDKVVTKGSYQLQDSTRVKIN
jgi:multidrug efflux pump subunit AcrA (membrane-fusion protein)